MMEEVRYRTEAGRTQESEEVHDTNYAIVTPT